MSNRYWIGGTGNWSDTDHWATASGGGDPAVIIDECTTANTYKDWNADSLTGWGQSFTGDGFRVVGVIFNMKKTGSPTGNAVCKIYAHSGTYGSSSVPTGTALATSDALDVSTLSTTATDKTFIFSSSNKIQLDSGTYYCAVIEYSNGDASNYISTYYAGVGAHGGCVVRRISGTWSYWENDDAYFKVLSGGGAIEPTSSDDVFIDSSSGFGSGGTITMDVQGVCSNFTCTSGHNCTINSSVDGFQVWGSCVLESGITFSTESSIAFRSSSAGNTITSDGVDVLRIYFYGTGGWSLTDNLTASVYFYQENGTFDANDNNINSLEIGFTSDVDLLPTVLMGNGIWTYTGFFWISEYGGEVVTIDAENSTIKLNSDDPGQSKQFYGGGKTYYNFWYDSGANGIDLLLSGSNTFNEIKDDGSVAHTIFIEENTTNTVSSFDVSGNSGELISIDSFSRDYELGAILTFSISNGGSGYLQDETIYIDEGTDGQFYVVSVDGSGTVTEVGIAYGGFGYSVSNNVTTTGGSGTGLTINILSIWYPSQHILSKSSGVVVCDYLDISNSNATGGATWYAGSHSNNTTNNDGWIFGEPRRGSGATNFQDPGMI